MFAPYNYRTVQIRIAALSAYLKKTLGRDVKYLEIILSTGATFDYYKSQSKRRCRNISRIWWDSVHTI